MKILWLSAIQLPATLQKKGEKPIVTGGWLNAMVEELIKKDEITSINIVSVHKGNTIEKLINGKIIHTLVSSNNGIFSYDSRLKNHLNEVISEYKPDLIDVQGIEFFLVRSLLECETEIPVVATIQGLASELYKHYIANIPLLDILKSQTLRSIIFFFDGMYGKKRKYRKRGVNELYAFSSIKYFLGRTDWDKTYLLLNNKNAKYYHVNRNLRKPFYEHNWDIDKVERFSIFTTQARYPIKGLHILLESVFLLKKSHPKIKLYVGGKNLLDKSSIINKLAFNDYQKYIQLLLKRYDIEDNVIFTGFLDAEGVARQLTKTHVFVLPSVIENSPNALGEAQIVGTPSVASLVGGNANFIEDMKTGLLYNCYEPAMLASKINLIFSNNELAKEISKNGKIVASQRHNKKVNTKNLIEAYKDIIQKHKNL